MRRAIMILAIATAVLAFVIASGAWITGQWYCLYVRIGSQYSTSYGAITIRPDWAPGPRFAVSEPFWKQPLWYDELPRPILIIPSRDYPGLWEFILPYWLILAFSLTTGGLGFWLARKRPHRYRGFAVST